MSFADKLTAVSANNEVIAENEKNVYDAGAVEEWNYLTNFGTRTSYYQAFTHTDYNGRPFPVTFAPKGGCYLANMFYNYYGKVLPTNIDLSGVDPNASRSSVEGMFNWAKVTEIPDLGIPAMKNYVNFLNSAQSVKKVHIVRVREDSNLSNFIHDCMALTDITFEGTIGKDLSVGQAPKLTHDSLLNIIECLKDYSTDTSGTTHTVTFGVANKAKLSEEELQTITDKGWTYA